MKICIQDKLNEKKITRYELSKRLCVTYKTIDNIYKGTSTVINLNLLEALCTILECTPNDILVFESSDNSYFTQK